MQVRFRGGPLDGQVKEVPDDQLEEGEAIYWPPKADRDVHEDTVPGEDDLLEYLYQGDGTADYVGGLIEGD